MGHFLGQPNESSPRLERFAAQQAWQSDLLGKSQKNWAVVVHPTVNLILHIFVESELFLIPKFQLTFKLILKINVYQYKIQQILHA